MESPDPVAPDDGMQPEPDLVHDAATCEIVCELTAAVGDELPWNLRLQRRHGLDRVGAEKSRVRGQRLPERSRGDVLQNRGDELGVRPLRTRPELGQEFVRLTAEDDRVRGAELLEPVLRGLVQGVPGSDSEVLGTSRATASRPRW